MYKTLLQCYVCSTRPRYYGRSIAFYGSYGFGVTGLSVEESCTNLVKKYSLADSYIIFFW